MPHGQELPIERLRESLAQTYTIDRELGRGGMSSVFLAQDCKHHRSVAIKVLNPELAASLGPEPGLHHLIWQNHRFPAGAVAQPVDGGK